MLSEIKKQITDSLTVVKGEIELVLPPNSGMGDLSLPCFDLAKGKNPAEVASEIKEKIEQAKLPIIDKVESAGPYVNLFLDQVELAKLVFSKFDSDYGKIESGKGEKIMVEFAHPNTHKAFHIGHLRNLVTGESLVRVFENGGYKVVRTNYQGDVGMHIAKCLWGIERLSDEFEAVKEKSMHERMEFLGKAYAKGAQEYEKGDDKVKEEILSFNDKLYSSDPSIQEVYQATRQWSLDYFDSIYSRLGSKFDRLYFESEVFARGKEIVLEHLEKGVFKKSKGAIIFEGSKHGLHDRVFVNSKGFPTYEAKDLALAEMQFSEFDPQQIHHVVANEQFEYFKVMFKALEQTLPKSISKEHHLVYGWLSLKEGKMSSRTGEVLPGEWLLDEVRKKVLEIMKDSEVKDKDSVSEKVAIAAVKYAILRTDVAKDIVFDIKESISVSGDSGPYLLYICARIKSILCKERKGLGKNMEIPNEIVDVEKQLLFKLSQFGDITKKAVEKTNPSEIAKYLFDLAQLFNNFYQDCPVRQAEGDTKSFRLHLISMVEQVMEKGLYLLGIETVDEM